MNTHKTNNEEKMDEMYELIKDNNEVLHSLLRRERIGIFFKVVYWGFILITVLSVYYKFDEILSYVLKNVVGVVDPNNNLLQISQSIPQVKELLKLLGGIKTQ